MSYQVLARQCRPRSFDAMVGQEPVLKALQNALSQQRLHHAYLFTGTRGVGKTTVARIFAKALNCEKGISPTPCGECDICQAIDTGRCVDLIEVDAASRTKVEDTRELLDNVQYAPTSARFKIYLIDEVHMLSTHSFNALLKTLEEPPPHVKFLLATTDPQKLPPTILSRCLQFHLKPLPIAYIENYLEQLLGNEKIEFEKTALTQIAKAANGSMRDALSILDQAIAFCEKHITHQKISNMLGNLDHTAILPLLQALFEQQGAALIQYARELIAQGADAQQCLEALISVLHYIAISQVVPEVLNDYISVDAAVITEWAGKFSKEDVQLYYQIALVGRRDLPLAPEPLMGLEMILLRMLAFQPMKTENVSLKKETKQTPAAQQKMTTAPVAKTTVSSSVAMGDWDKTVEQLQLTGTTKLLASHSTVQSWEGNQITLVLATEYAPLLNERIKDRLEESLEKTCHQKIKLTIVVGEPTTVSPAEKASVKEQARQTGILKDLQKDENLQNLTKAFDVPLSPEAIKFSSEE